MADTPAFDALAWKWAMACALTFLGVAYSLLPVGVYISMSLVAMIAVLGIAGLVFALKAPRSLTMYDAFAIFWAFTYGVGTLYSFFSSASFERELMGSGFVTPPLLRTALTLLTFSLAALLVASSLHRRSLYGTFEITDRESAQATALIAVFTLVALAALATGSLGYQGDVAVAAGSSRISPFASLVSQALAPAAALAIFLVPQSAGARKKALLLFTLVLLLCLFTQGRRLLMYTIVLCVMAYAAGGGTIRLSSWRSLLGVAFLIAFIQAASIGFIALRMATYDSLPKDGIGRLLIEGAKNVANADRLGLIQNTLENQSERTFIIGYLAEILGKVDTHPVAKGELLLDSFLISIPRLLYPDKGKLDFQADEALIHPLLGIPIYDGANTVLTGGVSDFGFTGGWVYAIGFAGMFAVFAQVVKRAGHSAYLIAVFLLLFKVLNVEEGLASYFSTIRTAILLAGIVWLALYVLNGLLAWRSELPYPRRQRRWVDRLLLRQRRRF